MQFLAPFTCLTALSIPIVYALFFVVELPCLEYMVAETRIVFYTVGCSVRNPGKRSIIFYFSTSIFYSSFHSIFPIFPCIFTCGRQLVNRRSTSSTANFSSHDDLFFRRQREQRPSIPNLNGQNQSPPFASPLHVFCSVSRLCCRSFSLRIFRVFNFICLSPSLYSSPYTQPAFPPLSVPHLLTELRFPSINASGALRSLQFSFSEEGVCPSRPSWPAVGPQDFIPLAAMRICCSWRTRLLCTVQARGLR